ncbi:MAG: mannose-6-phosphate isomerase, class I [Acidobacteriota bacterium]|nr:mannose-6-phosphate isomerase, class I [Acidobacteriota bacterium]MDE3266321.1 mannose-6-phosphate isomerase, class I [Acidobacteriota bacterium]
MTPLDRPLRLLPRVRNYDWGTPDFIPRLCGREPSGRPEAELWFGSHPDAPADVVIGSSDAGSIPLDRLIAERPVDVLGSYSALPFLTKVLSAGRPLSIQAHPSREQAARGFAGGAPGNYRDPNHKPELLYALTAFSALSGFRPPAEAAALLGALGLEELEPHVQRLESEGAAAYRPLLDALTGRAGTELAARVTGAARLAADRADPERRDALRWIDRIAAFHLEDPLVIAPLILRLIRLEPGQALFTGPGVPHSYLEGSGVEVMANSDNVLRLGLTSKRVDAAELLDILVYEAAGAASLEPEVEEHPWGRRTAFTPPVADFRLDVLDVAGRGPAPLPADDNVRIVLALEGDLEIRNPAGALSLRPGQATLLAASAGGATAAGAGTVAVTMPNASDA